MFNVQTVAVTTPCRITFVFIFTPRSGYKFHSINEIILFVLFSRLLISKPLTPVFIFSLLINYIDAIKMFHAKKL